MIIDILNRSYYVTLETHTVDGMQKEDSQRGKYLERIFFHLNGSCNADSSEYREDFIQSFQQIGQQGPTFKL